MIYDQDRDIPDKKKLNISGRGMTDFIPTTQANPEKVTIMVGTFWIRAVMVFSR